MNNSVCDNNIALSIRWILLLTVLCTHTFLVAQTPVVDLTHYQKRVLQKNDTVYVVNFWATWCKPCVEELPIFETLRKEYSTSAVQFILVSLDSKTRTEQVAQFIEKNKYGAEVFILSAGNPNVWIDLIEPKWSGLIPATAIYKNGNKLEFYEGDFAGTAELKTFIQSNF